MSENYKNIKFDVILQAGQSNAEGCGMGETDYPYIPCEDIFYLNNDFTISEAAERNWDGKNVADFSLSFAREYYKSGLLKEDRKILIVRAAVGGTGFLDKRWGMEDDLYQRMMKMIECALGLNEDNRLVAFIWHQGETDACLRATMNSHYVNLYNLVNSVKIKFNYPNLPFVAGDFVWHWKEPNIEICIPVIEAIKNVCSSIGNGAFVETSELKSNDQSHGNGDTIHFSRDALYTMGVKYFKEYLKLI